MTAYLMTRGTARRLDYRFLGDGPEQRWWAPLDDLVVLEQPAVLVCGNGGRSAVLLTGIPSVRRDVIGTAIRFNLAVDDPDPAVLARLVDAGIDPAARATLGARLDDEFPAEFVDAVLGGQAVDPAEVRTRLDRVVGSGPANGGHETVGKPGRDSETSWVGTAEDPDAVTTFRQRAAQLGAGAAGWAFTSSVLSTVDGVQRAIEPLDWPATVLADEGGPSPAVYLGKEQAGPSAGLAPGLPLKRILAGALAVLVVALVAVVLTRPTAPTAGSTDPTSAAPTSGRPATAPPSSPPPPSTVPETGPGRAPSG